MPLQQRQNTVTGTQITEAVEITTKIHTGISSAADSAGFGVVIKIDVFLFASGLEEGIGIIPDVVPTTEEGMHAAPLQFLHSWFRSMFVHSFSGCSPSGHVHSLQVYDRKGSIPIPLQGDDR
jgi:hypothetical protein